MMVLLKAVGSIDHQSSKNDLSICTHYGLRPKAMTEIRKIRRQLIQIGKICMKIILLLLIRRKNMLFIMHISLRLVETMFIFSPRERQKTT